MKKNPFLTIGLTGILITGALNLFMVFVLDTETSNWWMYYIVWLIFLIIGFGLSKRKEQKEKQTKLFGK